MNPRLADLVEELEAIRFAYSYGNRLPTRSSEWYGLAKEFEIGVKDLDNIALDLGYHTFRLMDKNVDPQKALKEKGEREFMKALRATSLQAYGMNDAPLRSRIRKAIR